MTDELQLSYAEALHEIESIIQRLESGNSDIDTLSAQVKRALALLNFCSERLRSVDEEMAALQHSD